MNKDIVEVVRCKKCIYKDDAEDENEVYCEQHHAYFRQSDFCNYGRDRDDVEKNLRSKMTESNARHKVKNDDQEDSCRMFVNDPFPALFEAFECLYKDAESVEIHLVMPEDFDLTGDDGEPAVGLTLFPDDGGEPVIYVSAELPFYNVVEIVAHEMAHVIAGQDAGHSDEWEKAFSEIHMLYGEIYDKYMTERLMDLED